MNGLEADADARAEIEAEREHYERQLAKRDPRKDPRLLDLVRVGKRERCVEYVTTLGTIVYSTALSVGNHVERRCSLDAWKRWARKGKVIRFGDPPSSDSVFTVQLGWGEQREINRLRNRLGRLPPNDRAADDKEVLAGLVDLALGLLEHHVTCDPTTVRPDDLKNAIISRRVDR